MSGTVTHLLLNLVPTLRGRVKSKVDPDCNAALEIVIDSIEELPSPPP